MTDQKHTKEPWRILQKNSYFLILSGPDDDPINILPSMSNCYLDKASRAIECVNACAGMGDPDLQITALKSYFKTTSHNNELYNNVRDELTAVTKQRDELKKVVEFYAEHCLCANCGNSIGGKAIEALTKTKESV